MSTSGCPSDAPVELSDGTIVQPEDTVRLKDLCEIVPLILETLMQGAAAGGKGAAPGGRVAPGSQVPIAGRAPGFSSPVAPGFGGKPGSIAAPAGFGQSSQSNGGGGGGGGGFGGGGGGRGAPGQQGPPGPAGPAGPSGPGTIESPITKVNGDFTVASGSPFVPVPDTTVMFNQQTAGAAWILLQAVFGAAGAGQTCGQMGIRVDGVDYPLTANLIHTFVGGVGQFLTSAVAVLPITLAAGPHTVEAVVRGDSALYAPVGIPVTVQANPLIPLYFGVMHG